MNANKEMADYILSILRGSGAIFYSWGSRSFYYIENGLQFRVNGFKHKGLVRVVYNEGLDLFDVKILTLKGKELNCIEGVYIDQLTEVIDNLVEKTNDYEESIKKWLPGALSKL